MLRSGGWLRLWDLVYGFGPDEANDRIEEWVRANEGPDHNTGWTRGELEELVRDEHSTFTWLLSPCSTRRAS